MKKLIIDKEEGVAEVIDEILNEPDPEITLVIPRSWVFGRTVSNFHLLKREADAAEKTIVIESVDEGILAFAKESNLESSHPLWRGVRSSGAVGGVTDIVPKSRRPGMAAPVVTKKKFVPKEELPNEDEDEDVDSDNEEDEMMGEKENSRARHIEESEDEEIEVAEEPARRSFFSRTHAVHNYREDAGLRSDDDDDNDDDEDAPRHHGISGRLWATIVVVIILAFGGAYIASAYFNHVTISIAFKQTPWNWQGALIADKSVSSDNFTGGVIAAQVFTSNKNVTETFAASSQSNVSLKAQGTITIYNDYSTSPQEFVATTRFLTPDGKIFRITQTVTVPGATKASNGTLTPSSINAPIAADQAGPDYNIGPVAKLTIPGFAGKPQAAGFYGTINASTTGGFTGTRAVPTAADIAAAQASTTAALQASLREDFREVIRIILKS